MCAVIYLNTSLMLHIKSYAYFFDAIYHAIIPMSS